MFFSFQVTWSGAGVGQKRRSSSCLQVKHGTFFSNIYGKTMLLIVVFGHVSVKELVIAEDAHSTCFTRYERKINTLTCLWF